ncbi:hypothetical protein VTL71DRAFT_9374 [Oculimacula yallundae]|uniref:F-box domain-containing protein n=1 Tax=Oculimacula yallundae TaxID=86028 RepID=A0ABR4BSV7_9HELO
MPPNTDGRNEPVSSTESQPIEDTHPPISTKSTMAERVGQPIPCGKREGIEIIGSSDLFAESALESSNSGSTTHKGDLKTLGQAEIPELETRSESQLHPTARILSYTSRAVPSFTAFNITDKKLVGSEIAEHPDNLAVRQVEKGDDARKPVNIPNEICLMILDLLALEDILSARQVSKQFSELGAGFLFRPFVFKPNRDDFERFHTVADQPLLISGLDSIRFETGTMDIFHMVTELAKDMSSNYTEVLLEHRSESWMECKRGFLKSAILEYANWNAAWRSLEQDYRSVSYLETILRKASRLSSIVISKEACSFNNTKILWAYAEGDIATSFENSNAEFAALLTAIRHTLKDQLKALTHDKLPVTFFAQDQATLTRLTHPFQYLTTLHLTMGATETPMISFWEGLGYVLRSTENLVNLRFGFHPVEKRARIDEVWYLSQYPDEWYLPLWKLLATYTWRRLKYLCLDGLLVCEVGLIELIERHASTLRHLHLCQVGLWEGSFQSSLTWIRDNTDLDSFEISSHTRAFHAPYEHWRLSPISDPCPSPCPSGLLAYTKRGFKMDNMNIPFVRIDAGVELSDFVLRNGSWPLRWADMFSDCSDYSLSIHSPFCDSCVMSREEIDEKWKRYKDFEELEGWESSEYVHLVPGLDFQPDDDVCEVYDEDGFDEEGFDRQGFDAHGLHYSDPILSPEDGRILGGRLTELKKDLLGEIRRNIPRYNE